MSDFEVHRVGTLRLSAEAAVELEREAAIGHVRAKIEAAKRKRHQLGADLVDHLVDVALEKMRASDMAVRAIYLTDADLDRLNKIRSREFGMTLHTHGYRDHIVRPGKHSAIYSTHGVKVTVPLRLSSKVAA